MTTGSRGEPRGRKRRWGRLEVGWPVSWCGSGNYGKYVPHLGSTWIREVSEEEGVTGQQGYEEVGLRCRDTGNFGEKGVSRTGFDRKEVERCSDTGKTGAKGVSRMG